MSDNWKYVSVGKCFKTIITALIMACIVFVPISFATEAGTIFTYTRLPYVGDGTITAIFENEANLVPMILPNLNESQLEFIKTILTYAFYAYFIILAADVLFSLILILFRNKVLRKMFEVLSVLFGVLMIIIALSALAFVFLNVYSVIKNGVNFNNMVFTSGISTMLAMAVLSMILIFKQFSFFKKPY